MAAVTVSDDGPHDASESLAELERLASTAGAQTVGRLTQVRDKPDTATYFGTGKVGELSALVDSSSANLVIVDGQLRPGQQSNLEELLGVKVLDRTALILDIFAQHAHSSEGKMQVELAQLKYRLTRLTGKGAALSRLGGGIGTRGPGEQKLEVDRRRIRRRITTLERAIAAAGRTRAITRRRRLDSNVALVSLVGYTNAGKSTLMNALTSSDVLVQDQLFSTLDTISARLNAPGGRVILISDTVGFVRKLPHELVEAFKSTLEEVRNADLLLHVVDASSADPDSQVAAVREVLQEIGAGEITELIVINKIDAADEVAVTRLTRLGESVRVSARKKQGLDILVKTIVEMLGSAEVKVELTIPYENARSAAALRQEATVASEDHLEHGIHITATMAAALAPKYDRFKV